MSNDQTLELGKKDTRITYQEYGKKAAQNASANPEHLPDCLDVLYAQIVEEAKLDDTSRKKKIESLRKEIEDLEKQKHKLAAQQSSLDEDVKHYEKNIEDIQNDKGHTNYLPFIIGGTIVLFLTFYLWSFYAAAGYAALNGVRSGTQGFAGVFSALSTVFNKGGFLAIITVLFPVLFLTVGFLIHPALERKSYLGVGFLLLFTFSVDAIIGYKISQAIHDNAFNAALTNDLWKFNMVFHDVNFYLVLAAGFAGYVAWGVLLHYTLHKWTEIQPDSRIEKLRKAIKKAKADIQEAIAELKACDTSLDKKEKELNDYLEGKVVIDITNLRSYIGQFMGGWNAYTNLMHSTNADMLISRANVKKEEWLTKKISSLTTDNY